MKIKIIGAGSIGNHLAHASRVLGWEVDLCDCDAAALERTRQSIFPGRYGKWDDSIRLWTTDQQPRGSHDLICIGTPPDVHIPLALEALAEKPRALLIEKPLCGPGLEDAQRLVDSAGATAVFVGYDHVVGAAAHTARSWLAEAGIGPVATLDVEFREHWSGIFAAHPWLSGPADSYLGHWRRGGGASGEHSHALNLWQNFCHAIGGGRVVEVSALIDYVDDGAAAYDRLAAFHLRTESGLVGRVVQDVVTRPPRKWARVQGRDGFIEWVCGFEPGCDAVFHGRDGEPTPRVEKIRKTRPDDFIAELTHLRDCLAAGTAAASPLALVRGLETALVVAAGHLSAQSGRTVRIDYSKDWSPSALSLAPSA